MAKPTIIVYFQSGVQYGYGHKYRSLELIRAAREHGHTVVDLSNDPITRWHYTQEHKPSSIAIRKGAWKMWMNIFQKKYDAKWIVFDIPMRPRDHQIEYCKSIGLKIANLNGPGWAEGNGLEADQKWADLVWVQDNPKNVILRRDVRHMLREPLPNQWFVFGGSADPMNLLENFESAIQRDPAFLVGTKLREPFIPKHETHSYIESEDAEIWQYMRRSARACVSFGIIAYELAAMGIPTYCFSRSPEHLYYAKKFESYGLGLAYPEIGIPDGKAMREFFKRPIALDIANRPDCRGAERFLDNIK